MRKDAAGERGETKPQNDTGINRRNIWLILILTLLVCNGVIVWKTIEIMLSQLVSQLRMATIENISKK